MSLGEEINKKRKENNLTQEELAEKMKVSRQAISDWERDVKKPELQNLIELSNLLGTSPNELLVDELSGEKSFEKKVSIEDKTLKVAPALLEFANVLQSVTSNIFITEEEEK